MGADKWERLSGITDLSVELHARYLRNRTYYAVNTLDARVDNPDQRIQVCESPQGPEDPLEYPVEYPVRRLPLEYRAVSTLEHSESTVRAPNEQLPSGSRRV